MKNYVQDGDALDLTAPTGGVTSGSPVKIGSIIAVPGVDADEGEIFAGYTEGVYDVAKAGSQAWTQGATVYWDDTNKVFTTTASGNSKAGVAVVAAVSAATTGRVKLIPTI